MATFQLVNQAVASTYSSTAVAPDLTPDRYGIFVVTHSGSRLSSSSTVVVTLQGSLDSGVSWFDIETMRPSDTDYVNATTSSWCRIVPLVNQIRISISNGNGLTYTSWVTE